MCSRSSIKIFVGECLGTFVFVFFGCGASVISAVYNAGLGLFQIALIWGVALTLAIYVSRSLSCAHFNPALSVAMYFLRRIQLKTMLVYIFSQFIGAALAALFLLILFNDSMSAYEVQNHIMRGGASSVNTAMLFINYFPNPAMSVATVTTTSAFFAEFLGTFFLILTILLITDDCNVGKPNYSLAPFFIGSLLTILICIFAPLTQASFNPARDLGPRLIALLFGWGGISFNSNFLSVLIVYVAGPLVGGVVAGFSFSKLMRPLMSLARP